jgi:hypothetical protein
MLVMSGGRVTLAKTVQPENAVSPMLVTVLGMVVAVRLVQPIKA